MNQHFISLEKAKQMTQLFRSEKENILAPEYQGRDLLSICETFDRAAFDHVLAQPGCTGLRIYYGMSEDLKLHAIIVGVDSDNRDMLPPATDLNMTETDPGTAENEDDEDTGIIEMGAPCPPHCPPPSDLNP